MELAAKLDDYGKLAWIAAMVLGFVVFWPVGLAILGYMIWSGRMGCGWKGGSGRWHFEERRERWAGRGQHGSSDGSSGNSAFDEYRVETLKRLEDEQAEFKDFLNRLRHAKDKAEFDQFMAERRRRPPEGFMPEGSEVPPGA
ncbi:MAG: DUF2852 domain-containing protein [Rhodospirillaceae bacterium]|nr:DUF2852 domain-containing protein [Rhodospirillaceae bacterium]